MQYPLEPTWTKLGSADTYLSQYDGAALQEMGITARASPRGYGSKDYKQQTAETLGASQWVSNVRPGVRAQIYDHIARTVNAIENGRKRSWRLNTASQDVTNASIQLMEICRQKLYDIQEKSPHLNEVQKAEARQAVFDTLDKIRRANSGQKTWTWGKEFCKALGKDIKTLSFSRELLKIVGVVTVGLVVAGLVGAGLLGPFAPFALPIIFAAVASWVAFRIGRSIYNACKNANKVVNEKKTELGKEVIEDAAILSERALKAAITDQEKENQQAMVKPLADLKDAQVRFASAKKDFDAVKPVYEEMQTMIRDLNLYEAALKTPPGTPDGKALLDETVASLPSNLKSAKLETQQREARRIIATQYQTPLKAKFDQFIFNTGSNPIKITDEYKRLDGILTKAQATFKGAQQAVERIQAAGVKALENVKTESSQARSAGLAAIRENRGKENIGTMKDELEAGRKERAAAKAATRGGPAPK